nr:hypothetical protein [uncultured Flavobacterium sp.]
MTETELENAEIESFIEGQWEPLIIFFWNRYNKRYFNQIEYLQNSKIKDIRNNCGFLIATIDCILIETLEQFYNGQDESEGQNHDPFLLFFNRSTHFKSLNFTKTDAGKFAGLIRSGLLHQSKTKKESIINKKKSTPLLGWIDDKDKSKGFELNRDKFHQSVKDEFHKLIEQLKIPENTELRKKFKLKLKTLT